MDEQKLYDILGQDLEVPNMVNKKLEQTYAQLERGQNQHKRQGTRPLRAAMIAAALAAVLSMTAYAAYQGGILQSLSGLFAQGWQKTTGQELGEDQHRIIDSLTERIDQSVTVGDVTVTLDSITVGDGVIWAYLYATGPKFAMDKEYSFGLDGKAAMVTPYPEGNSAGASWTAWHDDTSVLHIKMIYNDFRMEDTNFADGTHTLELTMSDLLDRDAEGSVYQTVQAGTWTFSVPLTEKSVSPVITLDCPEAGVTNLRISSTGIRFQTDRAVHHTAVVTLEDGTVIKAGLNGGFYEGSGAYNSEWAAPMDISRIVSVNIGDVEIAVN